MPPKKSCAHMEIYKTLGIPVVLLESKGNVKLTFDRREVHYKNGVISRVIFYHPASEGSKPIVFQDTYYSMGKDDKGLPCIVSYRSKGYSYRLYDKKGNVQVERYTDKDGLLHRAGNKPAEIFYRDGKVSTSSRFNHGVEV